MKAITLKNISKSFPNKTLFADVSFSVQKGDRVALVGENGAGKSTLLKIIAGAESANSGRVFKDGASCRYIPQEFSGDEQCSVLEYLDTEQAPARVFDILKQFAVLTETQIETSSLYELSCGQRRVLEIAAALSHAPMFVCIDEPENHLDIHTRSVLTTLLQTYWGGVLFISHDRYLVNQVANKIVSLQDETAVLLTGKTYEEFTAIEAQNTRRALADWKVETRAVKQLEANVRLLKARTRYNDAQAKTYQMKKRELETRREQLGARPDTQQSVRIEPEVVQSKRGKMIFGCTNVQFAYPGEAPIFQAVDLDLRFGDRVVLLGRNGTGKTTFLKLLQGELGPTGGEVRVGNDVRIEYFYQVRTLDEQRSLLEHFLAHHYTEEQARSILAQFRFTQAEAQAAIKNLSGGQRQRFTFLFLFKIAPECLVLDEPTNNLDPETWQLLLDLINQFTGTLLLISHDRSFVEAVQDKRFWVLKDQTIMESWDDLDVILQRL